MIPAGVQMFVALDPVDMRFGFERLSGLVRERLGYEPRSGALFLFLGKRRQTAKILFHDGTGLCVLHKRLERGRFTFPSRVVEGATSVEIDAHELSMLLEGLDLSGSRAAVRWSPPLRAASG